MTLTDFNALVVLARKQKQEQIQNGPDYRNFRFQLSSDESRYIADAIIGLPTDDRAKAQAESIKHAAFRGY